MELTEAVQRIVRHHIFLILAMVVLGMLVPIALQSGKDPSYEATARVGFDAADTATAEEAKARTDTATAVITSQGNVGFALEKAGIDRDPQEVAENHISVQAIGTSSVLEVSVTDKDPKVAMRMANVLAGELVLIRTEAVLGPSQAELERLDDRIAVQDKAVADAPDGSVRAEDARAELSDLQEARGALVLAMPPKPAVIDQAALPDKAEATGIKAQMAVGGLLGLAAGLALGVGGRSSAPDDRQLGRSRPRAVRTDRRAPPARARSRLATSATRGSPCTCSWRPPERGSTPSSSSPSGHPSISPG